MNLPRPFLNRQNPLRPAIQFLQSLTTGQIPPQSSSSRPSPPTTPSADHHEIDFDPDDTLHSLSPPSITRSRSTAHSRTSSQGTSQAPSTPGIPLIDFSRTPSPTSYAATGSEDEDYETTEHTGRPLVRSRMRRQRWVGEGGIGAFLFGSWLGWQVYVALLSLWWLSWSLLLGWMNRVILWSGVYKFPYPFAASWIQLAFAHVWLLLFANVTRFLAQPLRKAGLSALVAPGSPVGQVGSGGGRMLGISSLNPVTLIAAMFRPAGGIAGGGVFELNKTTAFKVLPLAIVFTGKVLLSNISFAYAAFPLFTLVRIGSLPLTLIFTAFLTRATHSIPTLSSSIISWLNLLVASIRNRNQVTWEAIVAGIFSILFISAYPILLTRTHKQLITAQVAAGDVLTTFSPTRPSSRISIESGSKQSTRAYYQVLHYTSVLSLIILTLCLLVSGELPRIFRNCYFLDVLWFWFICAIGGLAAFAVFASSLAFVRATSPLTTVFAGVPRSAIQIVIFGNARLPVHAWVGVALCWAGSAWYAFIRREESRIWERRRMEGR